MPKLIITKRRTKANSIEIPPNGGWYADNIDDGIHVLVTNTRTKPIYARHTK